MAGVAKRVPKRQCVICRESNDKRNLTRIVRSPEGEIAVDPTGRKNGRGTYLCDKPSCRAALVRTKGLDRAFKMAVPQEVYDRILQELDAADSGRTVTE